MAVTDLLTSKQAEVLHAYQTKPFKIMILTGAVRSGKTFIDNFLFLYQTGVNCGYRFILDGFHANCPSPFGLNRR